MIYKGNENFTEILQKLNANLIYTCYTIYMGSLFYYNDKFYTIFLSLAAVLLYSSMSFAENYLIPPGDREMSPMKQYLENNIEREDITFELLNETEEYCREQIRKKESVQWYECQLLKIRFDKIFLKNFHKPEWVEKQVQRFNKKLLTAETDLEKERIQEKIVRYQQQLDELTGEPALRKKDTASPYRLPVAVSPQ